MNTTYTGYLRGRVLPQSIIKAVLDEEGLDGESL